MIQYQYEKSKKIFSNGTQANRSIRLGDVPVLSWCRSCSDAIVQDLPVGVERRVAFEKAANQKRHFDVHLAAGEKRLNRTAFGITIKRLNIRSIHSRVS